jgi:hypothetical protein
MHNATYGGVYDNSQPAVTMLSPRGGVVLPAPYWATQAVAPLAKRVQDCGLAVQGLRSWLNAVAP